MANRPFRHTGLDLDRDQVYSLLNGQGPGTHYYVDYGTGADTNSGSTWATAFKTFGAAEDAVTTNKNDVIHVNGVTEVVETAMITMSKSRVHVVGHNGVAGHYGQGARISIGVTTDTDDIALIKNLGTRNTFTGIKFSSSNTLTEGIFAFAEGGEFTRFFYSHFYLSSQLGATTASEFLHNGDSTMHYGCTFGSTANIITTGKIRPNMSVTATLAGKKCRDAYLENCKFHSKAGGTAHVDVYGANATDVERMLEMKDCTFLNNPLSAATPAHAVGFGSSQTQGAVLLKNCTSVDHTVMAQASRGIYVDGAVPTFASSGVSVLT